MSFKLMLIPVIALFGLSLSVMADQSFTPYLGIDAKQNNMGSTRNTGDSLIQTNYPQGSLFAGIKLNGYLALEFGYESAARNTRTAFVPEGANFFGDTNISGDSFSIQTKTRIAGPHINIVGFYPIFEGYCVNLFGSFGLANLKLKSQLNINSDPPATFFFSKRKFLPRVVLGVQHIIDNNLGVRAMATWERTSSFRNIYANRGPLYMQPKDSRSLGVGIFYSF